MFFLEVSLNQIVQMASASMGNSVFFFLFFFSLRHFLCPTVLSVLSRLGVTPSHSEYNF